MYEPKLTWAILTKTVNDHETGKLATARQGLILSSEGWRIEKIIGLESSEDASKRFKTFLRENNVKEFGM